MKHIILCADDYGQNSAISQAILELFEKNRLSATTCMTNGSVWKTFAKRLEPFKDQVDIGLHFNLTYGKSLSKENNLHCSSLSQLIIQAFLRQLDPAIIEAELEAQIDEFVYKMDKLPDFLDGHQHVHQLPVVRDVLLKVYDKRLRKTGCYIRHVNDPLVWRDWRKSAYFKRAMIQLCGASSFENLLCQYHVPHNTSFSGVYHFADANQYPIFFKMFLNTIQDGGIVMCHPGAYVSEERDDIAGARVCEYQYFLSDQFIEDCKKYQIDIVRFKEVSVSK